MESENHMNICFKRILTKSKQLSLKFYNYSLIRLIKKIIKLSGIEIALMNDTAGKIDGIGAQLQRLITLVGLCNHLKIPFVQQAFSDVSVHPLDPFQDPDRKATFLDKVNTLFKFNGNTIDNKDIFNVIEIPHLTSFQLLRAALKGMLHEKSIIIKVIEPYKITNYYHDMCLNLNNNFQNWIAFVKKFEKQVKPDLIYIHYRQGVGGLAVYPGQKISREMPLKYYLDKVNDIKLNFFRSTSLPPVSTGWV